MSLQSPLRGVAEAGQPPDRLRDAVCRGQHPPLHVTASRSCAPISSSTLVRPRPSRAWTAAMVLKIGAGLGVVLDLLRRQLIANDHDHERISADRHWTRDQLTR